MEPILALSSIKADKDKAENRLQKEHKIKSLEQCERELRELGLSDSDITELGDIIKKLNETLVREKLIQPLL